MTFIPCMLFVYTMQERFAFQPWRCSQSSLGPSYLDMLSPLRAVAMHVFSWLFVASDRNLGRASVEKGLGINKPITLAAHASC